MKKILVILLLASSIAYGLAPIPFSSMPIKYRNNLILQEYSKNQTKQPVYMIGKPFNKYTVLYFKYLQDTIFEECSNNFIPNDPEKLHVTILGVNSYKNKTFNTAKNTSPKILSKVYESNKEKFSSIKPFDFNFSGDFILTPQNIIIYKLKDKATIRRVEQIRSIFEGDYYKPNDGFVHITIGRFLVEIDKQKRIEIKEYLERLNNEIDPLIREWITHITFTEMNKFGDNIKDVFTKHLQLFRTEEYKKEKIKPSNFSMILLAA